MFSLSLPSADVTHLAGDLISLFALYTYKNECIGNHISLAFSTIPPAYIGDAKMLIHTGRGSEIFLYVVWSEGRLAFIGYAATDVACALRLRSLVWRRQFFIYVQ